MSKGEPVPSGPRVLLVSQPTGAGTARHVADLAEGLHRDGVEAIVACPEGGMLGARLGTAGVPVIELPMVREIAPFSDMRSFVRLYRLCRRLRPDVLHLHSSKAGFLGRIAGRLAGVPAVVFTPHCWSFQSATGRKRAFYVRLERFASRFCDLTIGVSAREATEAVELRVVRSDRVRVIPNGVGAAEFDLQRSEEPGIPFLSVGRLDEQKGYSYLLKALSVLVHETPEARLTLVGDGAKRESLQKLAVSLGIKDSVTFAGEQPSASPFLRDAQVFVLSSLWEGLPYTIIEAMAAGLPVVSTDVGGCGELVRDGKTGLLVPAADPRELAQAMRRLYHDAALRAKMGDAGRQRAMAEFRVEQCVESNRSAYRELLEERRRATDIGPAAIFGRWGAALLLVLLTATVGFTVVDQVQYRDRIYPGVEVAGTVVGGLTTAEAITLLEDALERPVTVTVDSSTSIDVDAASLGLDVTKIVSDAYSAGRVGPLPDRLMERLKARRGEVVLAPEADAQSGLAGVVAQAQSRLDVPAKDARYELRDGVVAVSPSEPGIRVSREALVARVSAAALHAAAADRKVAVPVETVAPQITDEDAQAHLSQARVWAARPVFGEVRGKSVRLDPQEIVPMLVIDGGVLDLSSDPLGDILRSKALPRTVPRNARFSVSNGVPVVIEGSAGDDVDAVASAISLKRALKRGDDRFEIELKSVQPDVTREDLTGLGIVKELSSYTTRFYQGVDGRDENIALASGSVRGTVIDPGEVFSLNKTTGPRGRTSGYKESLVFMNGKVVPGIGGGVCQVSTTIYDAALLAGLRIVERHNHSMAVTYVDPGRDATAYYPMLDLKFQNTTRNPIMLWTEVRDGKLTVKVYGSGAKPEVRIETKVRKTTKPRRRMVYDRALRQNEQVVETVGKPGYFVSSYRLLYEGGKLQKKELLANDVYKPRDWVIRTGM